MITAVVAMNRNSGRTVPARLLNRTILPELFKKSLAEDCAQLGLPIYKFCEVRYC